MKSILVTGSMGNLGQAVVRKLLLEGYQVIGTLVPGEKMNEVLKDARFETMVADLADEEGSSNLVRNLIGKYDHIQAAVLTAGGFAEGDMETTDMGMIHKMIQLNFETAYHIARPLVKHMLEKGSGRIFFIGAKPGLDARHSRGMLAYGLSKSMVIRLAQMINIEARGTDVSATVIVPSTIDTPQNRASMPAADPSKWVKAGDIADVIAFYCSEQGRAISESVVKLYGRS